MAKQSKYGMSRALVRRETTAAYLFLLPSLIFFLGFVVYPMVTCFLNSFTLTLPGIAGIILSIGMGVDANIITAERIKEEILAGKTIDGAIERGSKSSFWAIFDGNVTVIIVSIVLMGVFGPPNSFWGTILKPVLMWFPVSTTGSIYSFGYTLFAGIVFNFLMGVTASRLMLKSITRFKCMRKPWLLGGKRA